LPSERAEYERDVGGRVLRDASATACGLNHQHSFVEERDFEIRHRHVSSMDKRLSLALAASERMIEDA
jgi:hypothetical protein